MSDTIQEQVAAPALVAVNGRTYPLESAHLVARAEGGMALSTLVQRFANPHDEALEVRYTMPLPADGAVLGYTVRVGERVIRAEVQPREKASKAYRQALYEGRTAGLLEQSRPDTFQQSLGNVPPKTAVEVTIEVLHPLAFLEAAGSDPATPQWEYRFPTVVGVRYLGAPGQVPDGAELSPDRGTGIPVRMGLQLVVADECAHGSAISPSHALQVTKRERGLEVAFRDGERLDRDVVVRWDAASEEVGARVVEGGGLAGDDGRYALLTLVPPAAPRCTYARDVTVLIDASGSMSGQPLDLAKRVAGELLRSLGDGDRYELIAFASNVTRLTNGFVRVRGDGVRQGLDALRRLQASGATDMVAGIQAAMRSSRDGAQRQVVLVTDGEIGFEHEVVSRAADAENVRLHAVGVGHAPNRTLTAQAAHAGRGVELLVTSEADAAAAGKRLVAATRAPVLTGLSVRGTALTGEQDPRLRDVFGGSPLLFTVELSPSGGSLELSGALAGEPWTHRVNVPARDAAGEAVARTTLPLGALHGRALVAARELGAPVGWGERSSSGRVERIAMRHRIASSETSLVAIAEEPSVKPGGRPRRERLAVELPAGVSAEGVGLGGGIVRRTYAQPILRASLDAAYSAQDDDLELSVPMSSAYELRSSRPAFAPPPIEPSVHWLDDELLRIEFDPRLEGLWLAGEEVHVVFGSGTQTLRLTLPIEWKHSARRRVVHRGQAIHLVVRIPRDLPAAALHEGRLELAWARRENGEVETTTTVEFSIPARPAAPDDSRKEPPTP